MNYLVDLIESKQAAVANNSGAMEADTISKNGRKSKSQMSRRNQLKKHFVFIAVSIFCFVLSTNAQKTINVIPDNAKIFMGGTEVGSGSYELTMKKQDFVNLRLSAPGYIDKTVRINKKDKSKSYSFSLEVDDSWAASDANSDLANKTMRVTVKEGISVDEAWKRITYYITDAFPDMEITDKSSGWFRSAWKIEDFSYVTVRTRIEIKEIPGQTNLTYRVMLQSEYGERKCGRNDQCFKNWDRVLKKYNQAVQDLLNSLN